MVPRFSQLPLLALLLVGGTSELLAQRPVYQRSRQLLPAAPQPPSTAMEPGSSDVAGQQPRQHFSNTTHHYPQQPQHQFPQTQYSSQQSGGTFQRAYPYHLDYYRMRFGGSYAPYFGNLYGPPNIVAPPYYGGYGYNGGYGYPMQYGGGMYRGYNMNNGNMNNGYNMAPGPMNGQPMYGR